MGLKQIYCFEQGISQEETMPPCDKSMTFPKQKIAILVPTFIGIWRTTWVTSVMDSNTQLHNATLLKSMIVTRLHDHIYGSILSHGKHILILFSTVVLQPKVQLHIHTNKLTMKLKSCHYQYLPPLSLHTTSWNRCKGGRLFLPSLQVTVIDITTICLCHARRRCVIATRGRWGMRGMK